MHTLDSIKKLNAYTSDSLSELHQLPTYRSTEHLKLCHPKA